MKTSALLLIFLGLVSYAYTETCPADEDVYPCTCDEESGDILVTCSNEALDLVRLKFALNGISAKQNVDLALGGFKLGTVPSTFFYGIGIKRLDISHCDLDSLTDGQGPALLGLENTLEELVITSSFTGRNVPAKLNLGHLRSLKELDLSFNAITELGDDWFQNGPSSLEYLIISNNGIEKVGSRAFANLNNLKQLSFDGNRFGPIRRSMFPRSARRLEILELDNNALTSIPEDMFSNMPALTTISFRTNGILKLEGRTWQPLWNQLAIIRLEGNPIECTGHMNWIFQMRRTAAIFGRCQYPKEFEGESLQELIDSRIRTF